MKYHKTSKLLSTVLAGCALSVSAQVSAQPTNIALDKTVTFETKPNYGLSSDPEDHLQLTDGKYSGEGQKVENTSAIWVQKETVGWSHTNPVIITIDLGSVQPLSGVSYSTAAGISGVTWPIAIYMAVSDDNKAWHYAGDLVTQSRRNAVPPTGGYDRFRYVTHDLRTKGRYIAFAVESSPYTFVDEIEVYKGDDAWLDAPTPGASIASLKETMPAFGVQHRLLEDISAIREAIKAAPIAGRTKSALDARLDKDAVAASDLKRLPPDYKTILPLNETHRDILAVHGELLAAQGFQPLSIWKQHRYAWLPLLAKPPEQSAPQLNVSMLRNQFRSDALLLTNAGSTPSVAQVKLINPPGGAQIGWLQMHAVAWTDTAQHVPVADALLPIAPQNGIYRMEIPAGMTRKIWMTVDSSKVPAGNHRINLEVDSGGRQTAVPFALSVSQVAMKKPRMSLGMWDYTNDDSSRGITPQNRDTAIALMRSHYVDTTWASGAALPRPEADAFDAQNNLKAKPDFSNFDQWVALWPDARRYYVFPSVGDTFADAKMGTPEFNERVGSWVKAISTHMKELGKNPQQLGILLVDEPHSDAQDAKIAAWAKAINAAAPELTLFEDPIWPRPDQTKIQDAITEVDLLCFHLPVFKAGGPEVKAYAKNLLKQGKELWLYQATGPVRLYDPQLSYRQLAWHSYSIGGTGQGFWSFGDTGGVPTSWNEYSTTGISYAPVFIDKNTVYSSLHWDAVREGIEDYEELAMLQDAINASKDTAWKKQAQQVLNEAVEAVTSPWDGNRDWRKKTDPDLTDAALQKVRSQLLQNGK